MLAQALAQSTIAPPPVMSITPPAVLQAQTNRPGETLIAAPPAATSTESPFRWGPVTLRPHALYRFIYGNGFDSTPVHSEYSVVHEFLPGLLFNLGSHITLDYTPTVRFYSSDRFRDGVDHNVILSAGGSYQDWTWGVSQTYSQSSTPLVETGVQTDQETFGTCAQGGVSNKHQVVPRLGPESDDLLSRKLQQLS